MAAIAIVAVSLTLSGSLTGVLVYRLELQNAQDQLVKSALLLRPQVQSLDCLQRGLHGTCALFVASEQEFIDNVEARLGELNLSGDRLVLLDRPRVVGGRPARPPEVLYDSAGQLPPGEPIAVGPNTRVVSGVTVRQGSIELAGVPYLVAVVPTSGNRYASLLVLARPRAAVSAAATRQLLQPILLAGAAGLGLAILVTALLSRAFSRPLNELKAAAEDIAAGNYARRVGAAGGDEIGVVGQAFNRMAEAVERARAAQRDFLANVSHELKTPLTSLIGFSQALVDGSLTEDAERQRAATILHEEAQRVLRMSQELLDLARVEAGQLHFEPQPIDLGAQLQQELEIVRPRAQRRGLALRLALPSSLPPVLADPERLHQILDNLLDNAVKYAPEKTEISISAEPAPGSRVLTVVANQVGAYPPDPDRMFERFYRADPSRSSAAGGVGLGLAISRELACAQGGSLRAELDQQGRLRLLLELPAATAERPWLEQAGTQPTRLRPQPLPPAAGPP